MYAESHKLIFVSCSGGSDEEETETLYCDGHHSLSARAAAPLSEPDPSERQDAGRSSDRTQENRSGDSGPRAGSRAGRINALFALFGGGPGAGAAVLLREQSGRLSSVDRSACPAGQAA